MRKLARALLAIAYFTISPAWAYDIEVANDDGVMIYYNYINEGTELEVTFHGKTSSFYRYTGSLVVPDEVVVMNKTLMVTSIGERAFSSCSGLTSVTLPNCVTNIGSMAFMKCTSLVSINIPPSVTSIGDKAFEGCSCLTSIIIPNSVTSIGGSAFNDCSGLTLVTIPNSVTSIGSSAFYGCSGLTSVTIPNSVTNINTYLFYGCNRLTSINIPPSITSIGDRAFDSCRSLSSITIPNSVTSIGSRAFAGCSSLTSITIPNSVTSIGSDAFASCNNLTDLHISDLAKWCSISFANDYSNPINNGKGHLYLDDLEIKDLVIPDSVTIIRSYAFSACSDLTSVTIPNSVTKIEGYAFRGCSSLTSVTIPNSVTTIGIDAFGNCSGLTSITIPNSVTSLGAFSNCISLTSISIPNSVTKLAYGAFRDCTSLVSINIPPSVTSIGDKAFEGCSCLTSITIPNSVTSIGSWAFNRCSSLTSITIPNSVTSIGDYAFYYCLNLTSVTFGTNISSIGWHAFDGYDIEKVVSLSENPHGINGKDSDNSCFSQNTYEKAILYIPTGTYYKYKTTLGWKDFSYIKDMNGVTPEMKYCAKPTIYYQNGRLKFNCETEGVTFVSEINNEDIKRYYQADVNLAVTYVISVYATREGYEDSEIATASLCWIDIEPEKEGITELDEDVVPGVKAIPVLIKSDSGALTIDGAHVGMPISVYDLSGRLLASTKATDGTTRVSVPSVEKMIVVKIGEKVVKVAR